VHLLILRGGITEEIIKGLNVVRLNFDNKKTFTEGLPCEHYRIETVPSSCRTVGAAAGADFLQFASASIASIIDLIKKANRFYLIRIKRQNKKTDREAARFPP